jgi:hypothetical protein
MAWHDMNVTSGLGERQIHAINARTLIILELSYYEMFNIYL